jgi:hypothetical protein
MPKRGPRWRITRFATDATNILSRLDGRFPEGETFDLYDSLLFIGKPDLSPYGIKRVRTVHENELWPPKRRRRWILLLRCESSATGTKLRVLTIVDTFSRLSPAIEPRFTFRGADVVEVLERVGREVGFPAAI